jgi:D-alanyl-D-alanine dipeptidase
VARVVSRAIPELRPNHGWREVPIEPRDEPLVRVSGLGPRVREDPAYYRMGLPGSRDGCWLRAGVAERLARVADGLPDGLGLVVWDGFRALETQQALYDEYLTELLLAHPDWPSEALEEAAARFVSPPLRSVHSPPPHLTGGAVDLTLADADGRPLDLGTPFDAFVPEAGARALEAALDGDGAASARDLRRTLFWAMAAEGFTAYAEEWWHYDHGDQFWGLIRGCAAHYGPTALQAT